MFTNERQKTYGHFNRGKKMLKPVTYNFKKKYLSQQKKEMRIFLL